MDGVLNVLKPRGPTSHDVVEQVRRVFKQRRVGHTGTLDPMADGVLVVCLGKATRIAQYLTVVHKEYEALMILGAATDTQDATGRIVTESDSSRITREQIEQILPAFLGQIEQVPPMASAVKWRGKRLYELARRGEQVDRPPRLVTVYDLKLLDFRPGARPEAELYITCSSGTYIRTLCSDIGDRLGCGAHLARLTRTRVGQFHIRDSVSLEWLAGASANQLSEFVIGINEALSDMPAFVMASNDVQKVAHGNEIVYVGDAGLGEVVRLISSDGALLAIGAVRGTPDKKMVSPKTVLVAAE